MIPVYKISDFRSVLFSDHLQSDLDLEVKLNMDQVNDKTFSTNFRADFFAVVLVTGGEITITINAVEYVAKKNDMLLLSPNDLQSFVNTDKAGSMSVLALSAKYLSLTDHTRNRLSIPNYFSFQFSPLWKLNANDAKVVSELLKKIEQRKNNLNQHLLGSELLNISVETLIYEIINFGERYSTLVNFHLSRKEKLVMEFSEMVQANFKTEREVKYYAAKLYITPRYLSELVKEVLGKSCREVIDHYVVQESIFLMQNHKLSISQVASELNFSDQSFFGKFFKRHTSLSPKAFRATRML